MTDPVMAYAARCPNCHAIVGATVDNPSHRQDVIAFVNDCLSDGLEIERMTVEAVREQFGSCTCTSSQLALFDDSAEQTEQH